ncbi:MAG: 50S ribosomal protein L4 [Acidobacteriota bacterium]|nr:50S ribosomal protein L4 [Acidobacteriota bacterium]
MKIAVKDLNNKKVKDIELPESVFDYPYREPLIHAAVRAHLAARRAGTHKTKTRREVTGSTRKPYRQKGTGRARAGDVRSPLWRSGGTVHGPQPRNYELGLTPREKRNALKSALSRKLVEKGILVVDNLTLDNEKTAALVKRLAKLGVDGKALLVDRHDNENLALASRNNPRLKTVDALAVTVYDVVDRPTVVCSEEALGRLLEVLSR